MTSFESLLDAFLFSCPHSVHISNNQCLFPSFLMNKNKIINAHFVKLWANYINLVSSITLYYRELRMTLSRKWYSDHFEGIILCILNIFFYLNKKYKVRTSKKKKKYNCRCETKFPVLHRDSVVWLVWNGDNDLSIYLLLLKVFIF